MPGRLGPLRVRQGQVPCNVHRPVRSANLKYVRGALQLHCQRTCNDSLATYHGYTWLSCMSDPVGMVLLMPLHAAPVAAKAMPVRWFGVFSYRTFGAIAPMQ